MPFFETRDGTGLAYEDYGSGPPIVLVAGWVLNAGMWASRSRASSSAGTAASCRTGGGTAAPTGRPAVTTSTLAPMTWPR